MNVAARAFRRIRPRTSTTAPRASNDVLSLVRSGVPGHRLTSGRMASMGASTVLIGRPWLPEPSTYPEQASRSSSCAWPAVQSCGPERGRTNASTGNSAHTACRAFRRPLRTDRRPVPGTPVERRSPRGRDQERPVEAVDGVALRLIRLQPAAASLRVPIPHRRPAARTGVHVQRHGRLRFDQPRRGWRSCRPCSRSPPPVNDGGASFVPLGGDGSAARLARPRPADGTTAKRSALR